MLSSLLKLRTKVKALLSGTDIALVLTAALSFRRDASFVEITVAPEAAPGQELPKEMAELTQTRELPLYAFTKAGNYTLPAELLSLLKQHLDLLEQVGNVPVLWLRLSRPYGSLGLIPWERELLAGLHRPVLRLPDFPARTAERTDVLENVVIVDPPDDPEIVDDIKLQVVNLCNAILSGSSRTDTSIHVFSNIVWYTKLTNAGMDSRVQLADPLDRKTATPDRTMYGLSIWTDWVLDELAGRGIDAVHLIGRGTMGEVDAYYLISATPFAASAMIPDLEIDLESIALLLNRAGAWSVSFTPAATRFRDSLAYIADALAHHWPGSVMFTGHHPQAAVNGDPIHAAAKLLYNVKTTIAPRFNDGFLYCHPTFINEKQRAQYANLVPLLAEQAELLSVRAPVTERAVSWITRTLPGVDQVNQSGPPAWLSSTQRFLESEVFDDIRRNARDVLMSHHTELSSITESGRKLKSETTDVLNQIISVVDQYRAKKSMKGENGGPHSDS